MLFIRRPGKASKMRQSMMAESWGNVERMNHQLYSGLQCFFSQTVWYPCRDFPNMDPVV